MVQQKSHNAHLPWTWRPQAQSQPPAQPLEAPEHCGNIMNTKSESESFLPPSADANLNPQKQWWINSAAPEEILMEREEKHPRKLKCPLIAPQRLESISAAAYLCDRKAAGSPVQSSPAIPAAAAQADTVTMWLGTSKWPWTKFVKIMSARLVPEVPNKACQGYPAPTNPAVHVERHAEPCFQKPQPPTLTQIVLC